MKLTLQIKLLPDDGQAKALLTTLKEANIACDQISDVVWRERVFNQFKVHHLVYHPLKKTTRLSAQMLIRCISKVIDAYKLDKKRKRTFKPLGAIAYDSRILSYKETSVSIWSVDGRLKIPFVCHNPKYLPYVKGEADLVCKKGKFYLFQVVEVPEDDVKDIDEFIGVDFGVTDIATLSDGASFNSKMINKVRDKRFKVRKSVQSKGTRGSRKLLKRLKGREQRFASITNHTISKAIVEKAKSENKGIAIEDLTHIRARTTVRKKQRRRHHSWAFSQLRIFLEYKARLAGIPLVVVNPQYTSKACNACKAIGNRNGKHFSCPSCGNNTDADVNAAKNIAQLGAICKQSRKDVSMLSFLSHNPLKADCFSCQ
jgi:IS605 OrfB family transposase